MPQYAVPDADAFVGNWRDQAAGTTNIFNSIIPDTPGSIGAGDDTDYIESPLAPSSEAYVARLSDVEDPQASTGHIMRWRRGKNAAGGAQIDLTVQLRQGYINEASQGTEINVYADTNIPDAFATVSDPLTGGEADAITDYTALFQRFVANQV